MISGKQNLSSLDAQNPVQILIIPFHGFQRTCNFSGWMSLKSNKVLVLISCEVATHTMDKTTKGTDDQ